MRSIGEMARASGLTVSALRFYDGAGLLVPSWVDPVTGYRWYDDDQVRPARLLARLRRVGMPLAEIALVLRHRADRAAVRPLLDGHLRRLEDGLADARRELSHVHALLDDEENSLTVTRLTLPCADLATALDAVRFAVGADPDLPVLTGVLFEAEDGALRLVATDRYRLAVAVAAAHRFDGEPISTLVPVTLVDEVRALLAAGDATITLDRNRVTVTAGGSTVSGDRLDQDFPDYRRLLHTEPTHRVLIDVAELRGSLSTKPGTGAAAGTGAPAGTEVTALSVGRDGTLAVLAPDIAAPVPGEMLRVGVNPEFLLEALAASGRGQLVLELDGPIAPLAIRLPDDDRSFSLLMPTKLS